MAKWQRYYKISSTNLSNNHKIRPQAEKSNMSGLTTPRHGFTVPAAPAEDFQIIVDQPVIDALQMQIPVSRDALG